MLPPFQTLKEPLLVLDLMQVHRLGLDTRFIIALGWSRRRRAPAVTAGGPSAEPSCSWVMARPFVLPLRLPVEHDRRRQRTVWDLINYFIDAIIIFRNYGINYILSILTLRYQCCPHI